MGQVLIRNLDDDIIAAYKESARRNGMSLEAELRAALQVGRPKLRLSPDELVALSRMLGAGTPPSSAAVDSTALIRADRDDR